MNWDAIGAIGEIVGAIAVVGTLAYLATQIRVASIAAESQGSYSSAEVYSRWRQALLNNPEVVKAVIRANEFGELKPEQNLLIYTLIDELLVAALVSTTSTEKWHTMQPSDTDFIYLKSLFDSNPGLLPFWEPRREFCATISQDFVDTMDKLIAALKEKHSLSKTRIGRL
ncbi:MAG: hypothetical protein ACU84Q_00475 [Gammaproteobacteria bacterium]